MTTPRRTEVHGQLHELLHVLAAADERDAGRHRYELTRVIDEHFFDVHRFAKASAGAAVDHVTVALDSLRAALRSTCLGEPAGAVEQHIDTHVSACPLEPATG